MAQRTLGRYTLDRKLATGGMAEIWVAHQQGPAGFQKEVVLKKILPHLAEDPKFIEMFLDEARLAARLTHPNIAQIFELGEADGEFFIAMEFVNGRDIQAIVDRCVAIGRPCSPAVAARIVADACTALDYAHHFVDRDGVPVQLVHRDVSPQNILVSNDGIVKLVDFGVAKAATSTHKTQTGAVKGKLSYMSPEQISGKPVDARSDIFALGIVLYELVTGRRPFGHESELLAITAILNENPTRPCEVIGDLPLELEAVILRALEKDPAVRFQTASEMQIALEHVLRTLGAILTARDVKLYVEDLFSDRPTGTIPALAGIRVRPAGAVTYPQHPSAPTRPGVKDQPADMGGGSTLGGIAAPRLVLPGGQGSERGTGSPGSDDAITFSGGASGNRRSVIVALVLVILLLAAGAVGLFVLFGPAAGTDPEPEVAARADGRDERQPEPGAAAGADDAATAQGEQSGSGEPADDAADIGADTADAATSDDAPPSGEGSGALGEGTATPIGSADAMGQDEVEAAETAPTNVPEPDAQVAVAPDAGAEPASAEPGSDEPEGQQPAEAQRPTTGTIRVSFPQGGRHEIFIDGERVGAYPGNTRYTVRAGTHTVRVVSSDGAEHTETVRVSGGAIESVAFP